MTVNVLPVGKIGTNCYLVRTGDRLYVIDPGAEPEQILAKIRQTGGAAAHNEILFTHGHADHIGGAGQLVAALPIAAVRLNAADRDIYLSPDNCFPPFIPLAENLPPVQNYVENADFTVLELPGHSPGSVGLKFGDLLFCGDTIFCTGIGRTDLPGGNYAALMASIANKIMPLAPETILYPGHGPETTVKDERQYHRQL